MKLSRDKKWMRGEGEDLHDTAVRGHAAKDQSSFIQRFLVGRIEFIAMPEAFVDHVLAVDPVYLCAWL